MTFSTRERYEFQDLDPDATYVAPCKMCDGEHEWYLDEGFGGAFGQGWVDCPDYGAPVPVGKEKAETR
jgi:hypothetical protein